MSPEFSYPSRNRGARAFARSKKSGSANGNGRPCPDLSVPLREEVMKLVQRVFVFPNSHAPSTVVFSSIEGSGSSEICFRAAEVLAAQGSASVCLVSTGTAANESVVETGQRRGLMEAMNCLDPITQFVAPTSINNLWIMSFGSSDVAHLFPSDELRSRMTELKEKFDYVLIDAPTVTSSPNAVVLGQMADGVILVVEANSTRHETARLVKETFEAAKVRLLGAILNNHRLPAP